MADVKIVITVDDQGNTKKIQDFDKAIADLGKTASTTKEKASSFGSEFTKNLIPAFTAATVAANLVEKGLHAIWNGAKEGIEGAIAEEQSQYRLATALSMTGRVRQISTRGMLDFAKQQMSVTTFTHEEIEAVMTLLTQLTKLDGQGIRKATEGAMGLASVLGMDLQSAALMVTKAMEGNTQALARVGIRVDENIPKEQQAAAILDKLVGLYPRATAELNTMAGLLKSTKNEWGEFKEGIGKAFLEATHARDILALLNQGLRETNKEAETSVGTWRDLNVQFAAARGLIPPVKVEELVAAEASREWTDASNALVAAHKALGPALEPIPIIIREESKEAKEATAAFERFQRSVVYLRNTAKAIQPSPEIEIVNKLPPPKNYEVFGTVLDWIQGKSKETSTAMSDDWSTALLAMTSNLISFGDANASIWENIGKVFGNFVKDAITGMEAMYLKQILMSKGIIKAKQGEATASHISNIFRHVPFPFDLILAAGAFAVVNALFTKLLKFEKGGYFPSATMLPAHVVGEAGPEFYLPEKKLRDIIRSEGGGGSGVNVYISAGVFDDRTLDHIGPRLAQVMRNQKRIGRA